MSVLVFAALFVAAGVVVYKYRAELSDKLVTLRKILGL